jgi:hypothetical protein
MICVRWVVRGIAVCLLLYFGAWAYRILSREYWYWLPAYISWLLTPAENAAGATHVFLVCADHYEPGTRFDFVQRWMNEYPALAQRHHDANGRPVQHTWFYPIEQPIDRNIDGLKSLVAAGYGEVELHLHHGPDTMDSARRKFRDGIAWLQRWGFLKGTDGATHFAFIHGVWALDNGSGQPRLCGVDRELQLLRELGCFADYTFPSLNEPAQPAMVNTIYMAADDDRPKSYNHGVPLSVGIKPAGDLMLIEGPLLIAAAMSPAHLFADVEDGNIHPGVPAGAIRVDRWMRSRVHVKGRPEWQFVKIHGHGAQNEDNVSEWLGPHFDAVLSHFERAYNDGSRYVLHYITAREAYNLARAATDGKTGDPRQYYDYVIPPYEADPKR